MVVVLVVVDAVFIVDRTVVVNGVVESVVE